MNAHCYSIGETLIDIIFKNNQPIKSLPGGSILNTSVSLSALKTPVTYITFLANDQLGKQITNFLLEKNINTHYIQYYDKGNTPLALAFLDEQNNATYIFYKNYPQDIIKDLNIQFTDKDFFIFGSFFAIDKKTFQWVNNLARKARTSGALTFYDPNIRSAINEISYLHITENITLSTILRASIDDLQHIFGIKTTEEYYKIIQKYNCHYCIFTNGSDNIELFTPKYQQKYTVPEIKPISTIGAGDTFNAAILDFLYKNRITQQNIFQIDNQMWNSCINKAITLSQQICLSDKNYL